MDGDKPDVFLSSVLSTAATEDEVETAIEDMDPFIGDVTVSRSAESTTGGYEWAVTFTDLPGVVSNFSVINAVLEPNGTSGLPYYDLSGSESPPLASIDIGVGVYEVQNVSVVSATGGTFTLTLDTSNCSICGVQISATTAGINPASTDATDSDSIETRLAELANVAGSSSIQVTRTYGGVGFVEYSITFVGADILGDIPTMGFDDSALTGPGTPNLLVETTQDSQHLTGDEVRGNEIRGNFALRYCHSTDSNDFYVPNLNDCADTWPIHAYANASDVHSALAGAIADLFNVTHAEAMEEIVVTREGGGGFDSNARPLDAHSWQWDITFVGSLVGGDVLPLTSPTELGTNLTGDGVDVVVSTLEQGNELGGTFRLSLGGSITPPINHNAGPDEVRAALQAMTPNRVVDERTGYVEVSRTTLNQSAADEAFGVDHGQVRGYLWSITFLSNQHDGTTTFEEWDGVGVSNGRRFSRAWGRNVGDLDSLGCDTSSLTATSPSDGGSPACSVCESGTGSLNGGTDCVDGTEPIDGEFRLTVNTTGCLSCAVDAVAETAPIAHNALPSTADANAVPG